MNRLPLLASLFLLSWITYVDRAAISSAKDSLTRDLSLTDQQIGLVFSAFALGYALAQIPSGAAADRWGPRRLLTALVAVWSVLTAATGAATQLLPLAAIRFLFGVAEAGAFPGTARAIYAWMPENQRGLANGVIFAGSRLGAALAFPLMASLLAWTSWRNTFYVLAVPGFAWALVWWICYRDKQTAPRADLAPAAPVSLVAPIMFPTMLQYFIVNFTTFLCLSWMQPYLKQRFALSQSEAAFYTMIPLLVGAFAQWGTGTLVDRLYAREHTRPWSRRLPAMAGFLLSAVGIGSIPLVSSPGWAAAAFTVAAFGAEMVISPSWVFCLDIGGTRSGAVTGTMNMAGNIGSFVCANLFPLFTTWTGSADAYFYTVMVLDAIAAACWLAMPYRPVRA